MNLSLQNYVLRSSFHSFRVDLIFCYFKQIISIRLIVRLLFLYCFTSIRILNAQIKYSGFLDQYAIELILEYPLERAVNPAYFGEHKKVRGTYF